MTDTKISAMSSATDLSGATIPIVQGAANKKADMSLFDNRYTQGTWALIGTLTTTSGSTQAQALGGTYKELRIVLNGVSGASASTLRVAISDDSASTYGSAIAISAAMGSAANVLSGMLSIFNTGLTGTKYVLAFTVSNAPEVFAGGGSEASKTGVTTHIRFSWASGNFDAGSISIYGLT